MKHRSLFCAGIWPFLLGPLLLLVPLLYFMWHPIEQRVATNAMQSLTEQAPWATVETFNRGRDVLLTGSAPSANAIDNAKKLALKSEGVRVVDFVGDIEEVAPVVKRNPSSFQFKNTNGHVMLSGTVGSQAAIDTLVAAAKSKYGTEHVVNKLEVNQNLAPLQPGIDAIISDLAIPDNVNFSINESSLTLAGKVASEDIRNSTANELAQKFKGNINNSLIVINGLVADEKCQELIANLLANTKINFATGKAMISESSNELIQNLAKTIARCPDAAFEVAGHTDSTGKLESNMRLSEQRAQAVVDRLVSLNLNSERFSARGLGPNQPIADNNTSQGRAQNRRIEFKIKSN